MESSADNNNNNSQPIVNDTTSISSNSTDAEADEGSWIDYIYTAPDQEDLIYSKDELNQHYTQEKEKLEAKKQRKEEMYTDYNVRLKELEAEKQRWYNHAQEELDK
ncbi:hypothetical protein BDF22DRAFT_655650 [Syncephalis plumigaleata]|nr:hypothetical protein BDF22DRAFT_655650 [Syncephalis plumigaleata]